MIAKTVALEEGVVIHHHDQLSLGPAQLIMETPQHVPPGKRDIVLHERLHDAKLVGPAHQRAPEPRRGDERFHGRESEDLDEDP